MEDAPAGEVPNVDDAALSTSTINTTINKASAADTDAPAPEVPVLDGGEGGWHAGSGPPNAAVYDSEEERLRALMPSADESALMKKRKLKAEKLISKNTGTTSTLNLRKVS